MSSVGQAVGAIVGGAIGLFMGPVGWAAALQGAQWGMAIGGLLDPPKGPSVQGPRLTDLSSQSGSYGVGIPRIYGSMATHGNIFWLEGNKLKEVVTKKKSKSGGKGGGGSTTTTTTYTYFATFAVGLCDGPISGIRRIWIGSKLFYDAGSSDLSAVIASNQKATGFTLYLGTDTQTANSRIQAEKGVDTPAYRGLAYIVFYDFALAGYGNSMMGVQVKVEVISGDIAPLSAYLPNVTWTSDNPADSSFTCKPVYVDAEKCTYRTPNWGSSYPALSSMRIYTLLHGSSTPIINEIACPGTGVPPNFYSDVAGDFLYSSSQIFSSGQFNSLGHIIRCNDVYAGISSSPVNATLFVNEGSSPGSQRSLQIPVGYTQVATDGEFVYVVGGIGFPIRKYDLDLNLIVEGSWYTVNTSPIYSGRLRYQNGVLYHFPDTSGNWVLYSIDTSTLNGTLVWSVNGLVSNSTYLAYAVIGDMIITTWATLWASNPPNTLYRYWLNTKSVNLTSNSLANVISSECLKSKTLTALDIDVTSISNSITGFRVTNVGALRNSIEPLQGAYPFDVYQKGYQIKFKPRGGSSVVTVDESLLGASNGTSDGVIKLTENREMSIQLPKSVSLKFFDTEREYDQGEQMVERVNSLSVNKMTIDLPISMTPTEAIQKAEVLLYLYWMERSDFSFILPPQYIGLEPSDVITILASYGDTEFRLTDINYLSDGRLECKAKLNKSSTYTSIAEGESGQATGNPMEITGQMNTILMDLPCITSDFDIPAYCVAANGYSMGWAGGVLYKSKDNGQTWESVQGFSVPNTIGTSGSVPATWSSTSIDYISSIIYYPQGGDALESVTLEQMLNNVNVFAYGVNGRWEIIAAATCTLQSDGSYILSNLLRGRAGTEHNTGTHILGDYLILLDSYPPIISTESSTINSTGIIYRSATVGMPLDESVDIAFTYTGMNLECLSPVYLNGNRHPTINDWTLTWIRRTRISGEWRDYVDVPLGETSEAYDVEIYTTSGYTTLKRTISVSSTTATYTSAQQVTDFGANQTTLYLKVYQKSSIVGQGIPLIRSITR